MKNTAATPRRGSGGFVEQLEERALLAGFEAHIDFQPAKAPTFKGYRADTGAVFAKVKKGLIYGWNVDNRSRAIDRNSKKSPDQRYDTSNLLQGKKIYRWEIAVPDGEYRVRVTSGDALEKGNKYKVNVEGTLAINSVSTKRKKWFAKAVTVEVTDGRLTITGAKGALRNRICFVDIQQLDEEPPPPPPPPPPPGRDPTQLYQAVNADELQGVIKAKNQFGNDIIQSMDEGDYLKLDDLEFTEDIQSVILRFGTDRQREGQHIDIRLDSPDGRVIASIATETGGVELGRIMHASSTEKVTGKHDVYITFRGQNLGSLYTVRFSKSPFVKIMALGDSITEARGELSREGKSYDSYRHRLYHLLEGDLIESQSGFEGKTYPFNFVGRKTGVRPNSGSPVHADFDQDHESHSGFRADQILNGATVSGNYSGNITDMARANVPDVVLLHIGSNDLIQRQSVGSTVNEIRQIIEKLREVNPKVTVVVAEIFPMSAGPLLSYVPPRETVEEFNRQLVALAAEMNTGQSRIVTVDMHSGFGADDTFDGLHPTEAAEEDMARRWYAVLKDVLV